MANTTFSMIIVTFDTLIRHYVLHIYVVKLSLANNTINSKMWSMRNVFYEKNLDSCQSKCKTYWHVTLSVKFR